MFGMKGAAMTKSREVIQKIVRMGKLLNVVRCSFHRSEGVQVRYRSPTPRKT